jgi:hypothetical protein
LGGEKASLGQLHFALRHECHSLCKGTKCVSCEAGTRSPHYLHKLQTAMAHTASSRPLTAVVFVPSRASLRVLSGGHSGGQSATGKAPLRVLLLSSVRTIAAMPNTHLHLNTALSKEQVGEVSKPSSNGLVFRVSGSNELQITCTGALSVITPAVYATTLSITANLCPNPLSTFYLTY